MVTLPAAVVWKLSLVTVVGRLTVKVFPEPDVTISFAVPAIVRVSLSRSIESAPPLSP